MIIGGRCSRDTPGTMPNPAVKPVSVDGTVWGTYGRANRCQYKLREREVVIMTASLFRCICVCSRVLYMFVLILSV